MNHILSELNNINKIDRFEIKPYDLNWPSAFEIEAILIRQALADKLRYYSSCRLNVCTRLGR